MLFGRVRADRSAFVISLEDGSKNAGELKSLASLRTCIWFQLSSRASLRAMLLDGVTRRDADEPTAGTGRASIPRSSTSPTSSTRANQCSSLPVPKSNSPRRIRPRSGGPWLEGFGRREGLPILVRERPARHRRRLAGRLRRACPTRVAGASLKSRAPPMVDLGDGRELLPRATHA